MKQAQAWNLESLEWQDIGVDGTKYALLEGRRDLPGEGFTYAFFIPAGFWDPAHWHTADARNPRPERQARSQNEIFSSGGGTLKQALHV